MDDEKSSSHPARKGAKSGWSVATCLLYGGAGVLVGSLGYFVHKWIKEALESRSDDSIRKEYEYHEAKHHRTAETLKRLSGNNPRKDAIVNLVRKIEFHFYRNQQISDVTALRNVSNIQKYVNDTFNVIPLTDLLRDNPSSLTPAEKHHSFNKVKVLCFCRLLSSLYLLLFRLWLHRIEINILGRQWLPQLISSIHGISEQDLVILQAEVEACEAAISGTAESNPTESGSMSERSDAKPHLFQRYRLSQYHPRQRVTLFPLAGAVNSEANYVFLTSTRWLEFSPGMAGCPNLIKPVVEDVLADTFPQHFIHSTTLRNLLEVMCDNIEAQIFASTQDNNSSRSKVVDLLLPETVTPFTSKDDSPVDTLNAGKAEEEEIKKYRCRFNSSSLTKEEDRRFVQGCLAETRDILESAVFRCAFIESRRAFLSKCLELLIEKLPQAAKSGDGFPLCRIFGPLCGVTDLLLVEVSEESELQDAKNQFSGKLGELKSVEDFCGAVYMPSIMCPEFVPAQQ